MSFEKQVEEIKSFFNLSKIDVINEGGCRFLYLHQFFKTKGGEYLDCLFACDNHLGYVTRLWFPKMIPTATQRHWNHPNTYICGRTWFAFSWRPRPDVTTLCEKLQAHIMGAL